MSRGADSAGTNEMTTPAMTATVINHPATETGCHPQPPEPRGPNHTVEPTRGVIRTVPRFTARTPGATRLVGSRTSTYCRIGSRAEALRGARSPASTQVRSRSSPSREDTLHARRPQHRHGPPARMRNRRPTHRPQRRQRTHRSLTWDTVQCGSALSWVRLSFPRLSSAHSERAPHHHSPRPPQARWRAQEQVPGMPSHS